MDEEARREARGLPAGTPERGRNHEGAVLPDSVRFALWFSAWCAGATSLDDARDAVVGPDAAHDVAGEDSAGELTPLIVALGRLRAAGARVAGLALPVPGDPLGLGGPASFNAEALELGEAVVLDGADLGLLPVRAGAGVVWRCLPAHSRRQVPDVAEADTALRAALPQAADALAALDVARWRPQVADELLTELGRLRRPVELEVPPATSARVQRMLALASRCRAIVALALEDDGATGTALEAERRRAALRPLDAAARRALVAACSAPPGR